MSPRDRPFGPDTLIVPCYLATGPDDPNLAAWKSEHPDWFEAGSWTRSTVRSGQSSAERDARVVTWMDETRAPHQARSRPGGLSDPDWAAAALRLATFVPGLPTDASINGDASARARYSQASDQFELYPSDRAAPARIERVSEPVDPITARIRDVASQLRIIIDTSFREPAATVDRSGSTAAFGTRLHTALREAVGAAHI